MDHIKEKIIKMAVDDKTPKENLSLALQILQNGQSVETEENGKFISEKEAIAFVGHINRVTLFRWRKKGLRSYKTGQRRLYRKADLTDFVIQSDKANGGN